MKTILNKSGLHILLASAIALTLLIPGFFFQFFSDVKLIWFTAKYFWIFFAFGVVLSLCRSFKFVAVIWTLLALLEITQFGCLAYFNEYLTPYAIGFMFHELAEVGQSAAASFPHLYYALLIVLLPYGACLLLLKVTWRYHVKVKLFPILVILFLLFPAIRLKTHTDRKDIIKFFPTWSRPSLFNTLNAYYVWLLVLVPKRFAHHDGQAWQPYKIVETGAIDNPVTIVLIMGESFTWHHMSLFGYERRTTPLLDAMRNDPDFIYKKGLAAANATSSTLPMFFTIQYNPLNRNIIIDQRSNLFHLAKAHGFKTFYISAQKLNCLSGTSTTDIDYLTAYENETELFDHYKDEGLIRLAAKLELGPRNFIVLHQRCAHAPYENSYPRRKGFDQYPIENRPYREARANAYDNAILYNDFIITEIIKHFKQINRGATYVIATSDHGEEFGEQGRYGHDNLAIGAADVPLLWYAVNGDRRHIDRLKRLERPTHYELGLLIAAMMGYEISNPNQERDYFYMNGVAAFGESGYLKYKKTADGAVSDVQVFH
jgi:glucan phosphoethanolaminetransferase (alkaline phosphatase superfamily)